MFEPAKQDRDSLNKFILGLVERDDVNRCTFMATPISELDRTELLHLVAWMTREQQKERSFARRI